MSFGFYVAEPIHPVILVKMKAVVAAGGSLPSDKVIYAESQFVRDISSEWSHIRFLCSYMADQDLYARYAIYTASAITEMSKIGSPTLVPFKGWKPGGGVTGDTNALSFGGNFDNLGVGSINSQSLGIIVTAVAASGTGYNMAGGLHSSDTGTILQYQPAGVRGLAGTGLSNIFATSTTLVDDDYFSAARNDAFNHALYVNGSVIASGAGAVGAQSTQAGVRMLDIVRSSAAIGAPTDFTVGGACISTGAVNQAVISTAFKNLKIRVN